MNLLQVLNIYKSCAVFGKKISVAREISICQSQEFLPSVVQFDVYIMRLKLWWLMWPNINICEQIAKEQFAATHLNLKNKLDICWVDITKRILNIVKIELV